MLKLKKDGKEGKHSGNLKKVIDEAFNKRAGKNYSIDKSRTKNNVYYGRIKNGQITDDMTNMYTDGDELYNDNIQLYDVPNGNGKKLRKDAPTLCAMCVQPPLEYMDSFETDADRQAFMDACYLAAAEYVGEDNINACVLHKDEDDWGLHIFYEPRINGVLDAKHLVTPTYLRDFGKKIPAKLREMGYDIDDCETYKTDEELQAMDEHSRQEYIKERRAKRKQYGQEPNVYKARIEKEKAEIQQDIAKGRQEIGRIDKERGKKAKQLHHQQQQYDALNRNKEQLKAEQERLKAEQERLKVGQERLKVGQERLKAEQQKFAEQQQDFIDWQQSQEQGLAEQQQSQDARQERLDSREHRLDAREHWVKMQEQDIIERELQLNERESDAEDIGEAQAAFEQYRTEQALEIKRYRKKSKKDADAEAAKIRAEADADRQEADSYVLQRQQEFEALQVKLGQMQAEISDAEALIEGYNEVKAARDAMQAECNAMQQQLRANAPALQVVKSLWDAVERGDKASKKIAAPHGMRDNPKYDELQRNAKWAKQILSGVMPAAPQRSQQQQSQYDRGFGE